MTTTPVLAEDSETGGFFAGVVFSVAFLYCWISIYPFASLAAPAPGGIAAINQIVGFLLALGLVAYALAKGVFEMVLRPRFLIALILLWFAIACVVGTDSVTTLRRLLFSGLILSSAALVLFVPRSREQFTRLIGFVAFAILFLSYAGVVLLPSRAIHQAYDLTEPALMGDWRGVFLHKNIAASAMGLIAFFGLYLMRSGAPRRGGAVVVLALIFLWMSNGKTALGMFPVAFVLSFIIERRPRWGSFLFFVFLAAVTVVTLGSALSPVLRHFVASLGVDATFTGRTDIWQLALSAVGQAPLFGYGFDNFWGNEALLRAHFVHETWAMGAAHAHNGYLEILLDGGAPALVLVLIWLLFLPMRDIRLAVERGADPALTGLFIHIWTYGMLSSMLESDFFTGTGPVWFSLTLAVFGLRQQAHDYLVVETPKG